jgi:hypothetical protein
MQPQLGEQVDAVGGHHDELKVGLRAHHGGNRRADQLLIVSDRHANG